MHTFVMWKVISISRIEKIMERYPILQSGFITFNSNYLVKPAPTKLSLIQQLNGKQKNDSSDFCYSETITKLYKEYRGNTGLVDHFSFMDKVVQEFARLLPIRTEIKNWIKLQNLSPFYTKYHELFLIDFFDLKDRNQNTSFDGYSIVINAKPGGEKIPVSREMNELNSNKKFSEFIYDKLILSGKKGRSDFLVGSHILFGAKK